MSLDVDKALRRAARLMKNAELTAAETIYKDILTSFPKNSKALRGYQRMKSTDVVTRPEVSAPSPQQMQAVMALYNQGQFTEVLSKLDLLLEEFPQVPVLYNLQGSSRAALCMYSTAIDSFKQGLKLKPNDADIYFNMGNMHKKTGAWDTAILNYESGLKIKPDFAGVYINLGSVQHKKGDIKAAIESYKQALKIKPDYAEAYSDMGNALKDSGELEAAITSYKQALKIKPAFADAYYNMGNVLKDKGELDAAIDSFKQAIKFKPDHTEAFSNMGNALLDKRELGAAIDSYKQALKIKPDYAEVHYNLSFPYLLQGSVKEGFNLYEWRWKKSKLDTAPLTTDRPAWQPQTAGRVLLWSEQGVGDMIMFASIIPELYECSEQVIVQTDARLIPLFRRAFPRDIVYCDHTEIIAENRYDSHIPMGSLPRYFRPDLASFQKASGAYLKPDAARAARLRQNLLGATGQSLCGISWRGGKEATSKARRSIALNQLAQALAAQNVTLVNLQYGAVDDELQALKRDFGISVVDVSEIDKFYDLDGLAALTSACDHIVSIDNVTVHLAGALGQATRVLLPFACDWRWMVDRSDSPWYPEMTLYRQKIRGDWAGVLEAIKQDLRVMR